MEVLRRLVGVLFYVACLPQYCCHAHNLNTDAEENPLAAQDASSMLGMHSLESLLTEARSPEISKFIVITQQELHK
eukprot:5186890-Pyramimonas_sp.AAC.1